MKSDNKLKSENKQIKHVEINVDTDNDSEEEIIVVKSKPKSAASLGSSKVLKSALSLPYTWERQK